MREIKNIAVLGGGLLGGSIALAAADHARVRLWARRPETVSGAIAMGLIATSELAFAVEEADLLILCVPVGAMENLLIKAIDAGLPARLESALSSDQTISEIWLRSSGVVHGERGLVGKARAGVDGTRLQALTQ